MTASRVFSCVGALLLLASAVWSKQERSEVTGVPVGEPSREPARTPQRDTRAPVRSPQAPARDPEAPLRDPTVPDDEVRRALAPPEEPAVVVPQPVLTAPAPQVDLRALVVAAGRPGTALVEVGGRLYRIDPGDVVEDPTPGGARRALRVLAIDRDGVRLEDVDTGESTVIR